MVFGYNCTFAINLMFTQYNLLTHCLLFINCTRTACDYSIHNKEIHKNHYQIKNSS